MLKYMFMLCYWKILFLSVDYYVYYYYLQVILTKHLYRYYKKNYKSFKILANYFKWDILILNF